MSTTILPTLEDLMEIIQADDNEGFCLACGAVNSGCEPDMRRGTCEICGENRVFGAEELLIMGRYIDTAGVDVA